jgi:hypothetical protein
MFWWISWRQTTADYRPLTFPPNEAILGWWCSGCGDDYATICAMVRADSEKSARAAVKIDWPEAAHWRFCEPRETPMLDGGRFKQEGWMLERFAAAAPTPEPQS